MKITNKHNLPDLIYQYLCLDFYDHEAVKDTWSATTLLKPIQEIILTHRHWEDIEIDAIDQVWKVFGSAVHAALEALKLKNMVDLKRMYGTSFGETISGKFDVMQNKTLTDYKCTSVWTIIYKSHQEDWRKQLSIYRWLWHQETKEILNSTGKIIAILRDWNRKQSEKSGDYPKVPIMEIPLELHSIEETQLIIDRKIDEILNGLKLKDRQLPQCTKEERWWNEKQGKYLKCESYCIAKSFCQQLKNEQGENRIGRGVRQTSRGD